MGDLIFVVGGAGSGKSKFALKIAMQSDPVVFVATCASEDSEMERKIKNHKAERPGHWSTIEAAETPFDIDAAGHSECLLVDSLTLWVSKMLVAGQEAGEIAHECARFLAETRSRFKKIIVVSDEVGFGIVPENKLARRFREILGTVNQQTAEAADQVFLVSVGLPIQLKGRASIVPIEKITVKI